MAEALTHTDLMRLNLAFLDAKAAAQKDPNDEKLQAAKRDLGAAVREARHATRAWREAIAAPTSPKPKGA